MLKFLLKFYFGTFVLLILSCIGAAQTPSPAPTVENSEDDPIVLRTELIQTGVMVFDKEERFVRNLEQKDFELFVDGKPVSLSFFERIASEKTGNPATEKNQPIKSSEPVANSENANQLERNVIFVVDDVHLSLANALRVRKLLNKFIEQDALPNDRIAIASTSGNLGFLQQFSDNKIVWRTAIEKITSRNYSASDRMSPPMTEYEAYLINSRDPQITDYFVELDPSPSTRDIKTEAVRVRARRIVDMANMYSKITYSALDSVVRTSSTVPGRKIVFFISDGFLPDAINSDYVSRMQGITDAAARANAVIYSLDIKGLEAEFPEEGSTASNMQLGSRVQSGERLDFQDGLAALADGTGGKFVRNTNDLQTGIRKSLEEASTYYLLAWEPADEGNSASSKNSPSLKKIVVKVKNRPELKVRFQKSYLAGILNEKKENKSPKENKNKKTSDAKPNLSPTEKQINQALNSQFPARDLPAKLMLNYMNLPNEGNVVASVLQIDRNFVSFSDSADDKSANVDLVGVLYGTDGRQADYFSKRITVKASLSKAFAAGESKIFFDHQSKVKPGLYQMRIAVRDAVSGRIGSDNRWIEIPDENSQPLSLSSLLLFEVFDAKNAKALEQNGVTENGQINVERKFSRSSKMRYMIFAYSAPGKNSPNLKIQTKVRQADKTVLESPWNAIQKDGQDPLRLASAAEIPLGSLAQGTYLLEVSVQDASTGKIVSQQVEFAVK